MNQDPNDPQPGSSPFAPDPGDTPTGYVRNAQGGFQWQPPTPDNLQAQFPQYEILSLIGHGGMGAVYRARQLNLDRFVAIKVLAPNLDSVDGSYAARFKEEARTMAQLSHPGIVPVFDAGQTADGLLYFVMECIDGSDLAVMIKEMGHLPPAQASAITTEVCDALEYAHANGVIHRDIKPANIMVDSRGRVRVADFGLAKSSERNAGLTRSDLSVGTPDFIAPEAFLAGATLDHRADLYAVGVMLYQMLTGKIPRGLAKHVSELVPGIDPRFDAITDKAMQDEPARRYQSAREFRQALLDQISAEPPVRTSDGDRTKSAVPAQANPLRPGSGGRGAPSPRQKPPVLAIVIGAVAAAGVAAVLVLSPGKRTGKASTGVEVVHASSAAGSSLPVPPVRTEKPISPSEERMPVPASPVPVAPLKPVSVAAVPVSPKMPAPAVPAPAPATPPALVKPPANKPDSLTARLAPPAAVSAVAEVPGPSPALQPAPEKREMVVEEKPVEVSLAVPELQALQGQFLKLMAERVTSPFQADLDKLNAGYTGGLDRAIANEKKAGQLDGVLALEAEKKLIARDRAVPAEDDAATPESLRKLRAVYREAAAKLAATREANRTALVDPLTLRLRQLEIELTKQDRVPDATAVRDYRETLATPVSAPAPVTVPASNPGSGQAEPPRDAKVKPAEVARWVLAHQGKLNVERGGDTIVIQSPEDIPAGNFKILEIHLTKNSDPREPVTDADLEQHLTGLGDLKVLSLQGRKPYSGSFLQALTASKDLESLNIVEGGMSPDAIGRVAMFPKLRALRVPGGSAPCAAFAQLPPLAMLESLHFHGPVTPALIDSLSKHPSLKSLGLLNGKSRIEDDVFTAVTRLTGITFLELSGTFEAASFAKLGGLPKLDTLSLPGGGFAYRWLDLAAEFRPLRTLRLYKRDALADPAEFVKRLGQLKQLYSLELLAADGIPPDQLKLIQEALPQATVNVVK